MSLLQFGDKAPNLKLNTIDNGSVALADIWNNQQYVLLVFLRHLG